MRFLTNLNATDCCQTATIETLLYFPTNSCQLQKHLGSSEIHSLKSALLGKIHALLQDDLCFFFFFFLQKDYSKRCRIVFKRKGPM